jgi:ribosomal protein S18 acetylase RimI-like enzyme
MKPKNIEVEIKKLGTTPEAKICAGMMAGSEPWVTLGRDYETALNLITDPERDVYLAQVGDKIAGFIIYIMQGALIGYIQSVCVAMEWRNQGIGTQLMAFVEDRIFRISPNIFIMVSSFNPDAKRLYNRLGYQTVGEIDDYIVPGHSELLLRKTIAPISEFEPKQ